MNDASFSMEISTFPCKKISKAKPMVWTEEKFLAVLSKHKVRLTKDGKLFAPATFKKSRSNKNFISASGICLDFDHGQPTPESALALFPGNLAAYYTTHSHTPESPRFRVVLPLSRPVDAEEHTRLVAGIKSIITPELMECLDKSCFEKARAHFLPSCPRDMQDHAFSGHQKGELLDVEHFMRLGLDLTEPVKPPTRKTKPGTETAPTSSSLAYVYTCPTTGEMIDLTAWAAGNPTFDIVKAIKCDYALGQVVDGKLHIRCPFHDQHTDSSPDSATFVANADHDHPSWTTHCMHSHCAGRDRLEFLQVMLNEGWIDPSKLIDEPLELRNPQWVSLQVKEILSSTQWMILAPDERRIAWDLQFLAWQSDDGTIEGNDWRISKFLGIDENEWLSYRQTLTLAGWLIEINGRLTNSLVMREFNLAQLAYSKKCTGGRKGGLAAQEKRKKQAYLEHSLKDT